MQLLIHNISSFNNSKPHFISSINWIIIFLIILFLNWGLQLFAIKYIFTDDYYYNELISQLSVERVNELLKARSNGILLSLALTPFILTIKFLTITIVIFGGVLFCDLDIKFESTFKIVIISELIFFFQSLLQCFLLLIYGVSELKLIAKNYSLSLLSIFDVDKLPKYLLFAFSQINLFQVFYLIMIIKLFQSISDVSIKRLVLLISSSYGIWLLSWLLIVVFFQTQFS